MGHDGSSLLSTPLLERVEDRVHVVRGAAPRPPRTLCRPSRVRFTSANAPRADRLPDRLALHLLEELERLVEHLHGALRDDAVRLELDLVAEVLAAPCRRSASP